MTDIEKLNFPDEVKYSSEHTWVKAAGDTAIVGISDYAQDQLGEIIFVELPHPGDSFGPGQVFGVVESAKTASELYMPVAGTVSEVNEALEDNPERVNEDPFGQGWMLKVKVDDPGRMDTLLDNKAYIEGLL